MSLKAATTREVNSIYRKHGLDAALQAAFKVLRETERGSDLRDEKAEIKGELAEATLLCILKEIQKNLTFETVILKGVFVRDDRSGRVTELDVTFITPYAVYLFECKSYSGTNKEVRGQCELYRNGEMIANVFSQNCYHLAMFNRRYGGSIVYGSKPYRLVVYDYATNSYKDTRDEKVKKVMPVLNQSNIVQWLMGNISLATKKGVVVNVQKLVKAITEDVVNTDSENQQAHRQQLNY